MATSELPQSTIKTQACLPCAKRKVRCDREEPCSNCKRRRQDRCIYPGSLPLDRIQKLEDLVRSLGGDPSQVDEQPGILPPPAIAPNVADGANGFPRDDPSRIQRNTVTNNETAAQIRPKISSQSDDLLKMESEVATGIQPVIMEEDGETVYLESSAWHNWNNKPHEMGYILKPGDTDHFPRPPALEIVGSYALQSIESNYTCAQLAKRHPTRQNASTLWRLYRTNVHPLMKIFFDWELDQLQEISSSGRDAQVNFVYKDHAVIFAIYLISVLSMSDEEAVSMLGQSRSTMLSDFQLLCEQSLVGCNFFCTADINVLRAVATYVASGLDRQSTKSLWSLMGLLTRNAERLGIHRDGSLLDLSPFETEKRRRLWWQMQHIDIALSIRLGSSPMTLMADWDAKMPLNIEDCDISENSKESPKERRGLTSISHCLWTYWIVREQRSFRRVDGTRLGFAWSWASNRILQVASKDALLDRLEKGINENFLQYCDPIKPLDILIQYHGRSFLTAMRRLLLHHRTQSLDSSDEQYDQTREGLLDTCAQCLEYDIAVNSHQSIRHFKWRIKGYFQWSAVVCIIIEAWKNPDSARTESTWDLLSRLYSANQGLAEMARDRRKAYAARLIIAAWNAREKILLERQMSQRCDRRGYLPKPSLVAMLESRLAECGMIPPVHKREQDDQASDRLPKKPRHRQDNSGPRPVPTAVHEEVPPYVANDVRPTDNILVEYMGMGDIADLEFDDIDWNFWEHFASV